MANRSKKQSRGEKIIVLSQFQLLCLALDFNNRSTFSGNGKPADDGASAGDALKEYLNHEPRTSSSEWRVERYIEAKPGQEIQVEIYLKSSFKFFAADALMAFLHMENGTIRFCRCYRKDFIATEVSESKPFIFHDVLNTKGRQHSRVSFSFGSLNLDK